MQEWMRACLLSLLLLSVVVAEEVKLVRCISNRMFSA